MQTIPVISRKSGCVRVSRSTSEKECDETTRQFVWQGGIEWELYITVCGGGELEQVDNFVNIDSKTTSLQMSCVCL